MDEKQDSSGGGEGERDGPGECDVALRSCAERKQAHRRQPAKTKVSQFESYVSRSGLKSFLASFFVAMYQSRCPRALETGAYSKPQLHKNKGFFFKPGVALKSPPGVTLGY
jgi:hypothetical protein